MTVTLRVAVMGPREARWVDEGDIWVCVKVSGGGWPPNYSKEGLPSPVPATTTQALEGQVEEGRILSFSYELGTHPALPLDIQAPVLRPSGWDQVAPMAVLVSGGWTQMLGLLSLHVHMGHFL